MSYSLSFSEDFYFAEGEPYDRSDLAVDSQGRPVSVWSAIDRMRLEEPEQWDELASEVFDCKGEYLTTESVLDKIRETNTCSNLSVPVEVWIDPCGDFMLEVWDANERKAAS